MDGRSFGDGELIHMGAIWDEDKALFLLKNWIDEGEWKGTTHFRKHNSSLYEFLYRSVGLNKAFKQIGLNYSDFKRSQGKHQKGRKEEESLNELYHLITHNQWKGIRHLQLHHSLLYRELSRIGFAQAFSRLGLDDKAFRRTSWNQDQMLKELKEIIERKEWKGTSHLKDHNGRLYNAIEKSMGFPNAFQAIGLNYEDYKYSIRM